MKSIKITTLLFLFSIFTISSLASEVSYFSNGKCSHCGSTHVAKYLYGKPHFTPSLNEKIDKGEVVLGGCMVSEASPKYKCLDCGTKLYIKIKGKK